MDIPYLREIDAPWINEVISERFGNATELLTPNAVIYGGATRDALAGLPLLGDLDISVPPQELPHILGVFDDDVRWRRRNAEEGPLARLRNSNPNRADELPMQEIVEFVTFDDAVVQIMVSNTQGKDKFQKALGLARQVDLICCSIVLTSDGRVFETLENGRQDCLDRVLRANLASPTIHLDSMPQRIEKLSGRGWVNQVDMPAVVKHIEDARKKAERKKMREHRRAQKRHKNMLSAAKAADKRAMRKSASDDLEIRRFPHLPDRRGFIVPQKMYNEYFNEDADRLRKILAQVDSTGNIGFYLSDDGLWVYHTSTAHLARLREEIRKHIRDEKAKRRLFGNGNNFTSKYAWSEGPMGMPKEMKKERPTIGEKLERIYGDKIERKKITPYHPRQFEAEPEPGPAMRRPEVRVTKTAKPEWKKVQSLTKNREE